jgi:hypothetical protein
MKKLVIISLALTLSAGAFAQTSGIGIGAILGSNVDFTAKFWLSEKNAFVASTGFYIWGYGGFHVNADFLIHNWTFDWVFTLAICTIVPMYGLRCGPRLGWAIISTICLWKHLSKSHRDWICSVPGV